MFVNFGTFCKMKYILFSILNFIFKNINEKNNDLNN